MTGYILWLSYIGLRYHHTETIRFLCVSLGVYFILEFTFFKSVVTDPQEHIYMDYLSLLSPGSVCITPINANGHKAHALRRK